MASASSFGSRTKGDGWVSFRHGDEKRVILIDRNKVINESDAIVSLLRIMREILMVLFSCRMQRLMDLDRPGRRAN